MRVCKNAWQCCTHFSEEALFNVFRPPLTQDLAIVGKVLFNAWPFFFKGGGVPKIREGPTLLSCFPGEYLLS